MSPRYPTEVLILHREGNRLMKRQQQQQQQQRQRKEAKKKRAEILFSAATQSKSKAVHTVQRQARPRLSKRSTNQENKISISIGHGKWLSD